LNTPHWHILGAGAMGCLFAQQLMAAGCRVTLLQRTEPTQGVSALCVETDSASQMLPVHLSAMAETDTISLLLVATKAPDIEAALSAVRHRLTDATDIVLAANGMGFIAGVRALLPANRLFSCTTTEGAHRIGALHIRHAGRGLTHIGNVDGGDPPAWFKTWLDTPLDCHWEPDINAALWQKLAVNCAINPLTALHRCNNGALARDKTLRAQVATLCDEIAAVSNARGCAATAASVHSAVAAVINATATNRSSMLQDIEAGRSTEINFITGFLVAEAKRLEIPVPANQTLLEEVKALAQ
jgi:2-dehydropantoate 2-reductase